MVQDSPAGIGRWKLLEDDGVAGRPSDCYEGVVIRKAETIL